MCRYETIREGVEGMIEVHHRLSNRQIGIKYSNCRKMSQTYDLLLDQALIRFGFNINIMLHTFILMDFVYL